MHIILDLDETLINSQLVQEEDFDNSLASFLLVNPETKEKEFRVFKRPHYESLLKWILDNVYLSFWSAGEKQYVFDIISNIVPKESISKIKYIFWRDHCDLCEKETGHLKDLIWMMDNMPEMKEYGNMILIDDLQSNIDSNKGRAIKVLPFDLDNILEMPSIEIQQQESINSAIENNNIDNNSSDEDGSESDSEIEDESSMRQKLSTTSLSNLNEDNLDQKQDLFSSGKKVKITKKILNDTELKRVLELLKDEQNRKNSLWDV